MFVFDRQRFLADCTARTGVTINGSRREGLTFLLEQFERDPGFTMVRELAYVLATIHWETGRRFAPIRELQASSAKNPRVYALQQRYWPSGFYGRGYVQLTWDYNYRKAGQRMAGERFVINGTPVTVTADTFVAHPDFLLDPAVSYRIASRGMREGWFTGKRLSQYITESAPPDYFNARRIINGTDCAAEIAAIANGYELLLRAALRSAPVGVVAAAPSDEEGGVASVWGVARGIDDADDTGGMNAVARGVGMSDDDVDDEGGVRGVGRSIDESLREGALEAGVGDPGEEATLPPEDARAQSRRERAAAKKAKKAAERAQVTPKRKSPNRAKPTRNTKPKSSRKANQKSKGKAAGKATKSKSPRGRTKRSSRR